MKIYEDLLKEEPNELSKEHAKWQKKLMKSIGWYEPDSETESKETWEVTLEPGKFFTCHKQVEAELLSYIVQINERLKRVEKLLEKK